jgi:hypothetical protein
VRLTVEVRDMFVDILVAGRLHCSDVRDSQPMKTSTGVMTASAFVLIACAGAAMGAGDARTIERSAWFAGLPVKLQVQIPKAHGGAAPNAPSDAHPDVLVYVTGATRTGAPSVPEMTVPTPNGPRVLPAHDDVLTRMVPAKTPADSIGYFVVRGPKADESTVRAQADPPNSWPGAPLAREIFVGTDWVRLTNHAIIEYGVAMGWLTLKYFDYGGLVSSSYLDDKTRLDVDVAITPPVGLPARVQE